MKLLTQLIAGLSLCAATAAASATPLLDTVTGNATVNLNAPVEFTIDITDDNVAYDPLLNTLSNVVLHLNLADSNKGNEQYFVYFGDNATASYSGHNINGATTLDIILDAAALADLSDGHIKVKLASALQGGDDRKANYDYKGATLSADIGLIKQVSNIDTPRGDVPEPASLALLGAGLLGLLAARKRKQ